MTSSLPTIFHITHWKAGSQWIAEILKYSAPDRFIQWKVDKNGVPEFIRSPIIPGKIYGTVYLSFQELERIIYNTIVPPCLLSDLHNKSNSALKNWFNFGFSRKPIIIFVAMRDLRDTLISLYFSAKNSHAILNDNMAEDRVRLHELNKEDGILYVLNKEKIIGNASVAKIAKIQHSWMGHPDILLFRYEDIIGNEYTFFERLIEACQIPIVNENLRDIVRHNIFENTTGRKRGNENTQMHLRKGIAGDWRNHFSERIKDEFKKQYGQLLIETGYEKDLTW